MLVVFTFFNTYMYMQPVHPAILEDSSLPEVKLATLIEEASPNLPYEFWSRNKDKKENKTCGDFPDVLDIKWRDSHWQLLHQPPQPPIYLFSAYIDDRMKDRRFVRVIALNEEVSIYKNIHTSFGIS